MGIRYLRPGIAMQLHSRGFLIRQASKGALNHVLGMAICQLDTGLDDAPACPLSQDSALGVQVPCDGKC